MEISMKLAYQFMAIFFNFSPTLNHLHPLQVENCDRNSRLVVYDDDNVKSGLKRLKHPDPLKNHFASLNNDLIPYTWGFYTEHFYETVLIRTYFPFICHPHQIIFIHHKSRIAIAIRGFWWTKMTMVKELNLRVAV